MGSKIKTLREEAEKLGINLDANETISDLEAKIMLHKSTFKVHSQESILDPTTSKKVKEAGELEIKINIEVPSPRRQPVKHINFTRRIDREAKKNG